METSEIKKNNILALFDSIRYTHSLSDIGYVAGTRITIWTRRHNPKEIRNFDTIILSPLASRMITNNHSIMEKEILRKLEEGGHICILCDSDSSQDQVIADILSMVSSRTIRMSPFSEINVHRSEFRDFLRNYGIVPTFL